jgi:protein subunit release factor B
MELHLTKKDFEIQWFSGTGGGGQYRNKHQNCCRIIHKETGLRCQETRFRERPQNQKSAFTKLARLVIVHYSAEVEDRIPSTEEVRVYHGVRNEVRDHASGMRMLYRDVVEKGNLGPMIEARRIASN